jgi:hypothetical protein
MGLLLKPLTSESDVYEPTAQNLQGFYLSLRGRVSGLLGRCVPPFTVPLKIGSLYHNLAGDSSFTREMGASATQFGGEAPHRRALDTSRGLATKVVLLTRPVRLKSPNAL